MPTPGQPSQQQRRELAREVARTLREQQQRARRRRRLWVQAGVISLTLGIGALVLVLVLQSQADAVRNAATPRNLSGDGFVIPADAGSSPAPAGSSGSASPQATQAAATDVTVVTYLDFLCPYCRNFERENGDLLDSLRARGANIEVHPIAMLDRFSQQSHYSTRSANAFACVVDADPNNALAMLRALFAEQPDENTPGHDTNGLIAIARKAGVTSAEVDTCIRTGRFEGWVTRATDLAMRGVTGANVSGFPGTPFVLVNRTWWNPNLKQSFASFLKQQTGLE